MISRLRQLTSIRLIKLVQRFGPRKVEVLGKTYEISRHVFNPKFYFTSRFMANNLIISKGDVVLDMGTGSGIQAITAGESASMVIAIDINPEAVKFARKNVIANNLGDKVLVVEGDLFSPIKPEILFDIILFTPPYMEGEPATDFEYALYDHNKLLIKRFFKEAGNYLKPEGNVQMLYSSVARHNEALEIAVRLGWKHSLIAHERTVMEDFFIYKLSL